MNFSPDPKHNIENLIAKNSSKSLSIYLVVVLVLMGVVVCLPRIEIDISSQSRGVVRPRQEKTPIQTLVGGRVIYSRLKDNRKVKAGDTLLFITQDNILLRHRLNDSILQSYKADLRDLSYLLDNQSDSLSVYKFIKEHRLYTAKKQELQSKVEHANTNYKRYKKLYQKAVISKAEYENHLYQLRFAKETLSSFENQQQANWQSQRHELKLQADNLESEQDRLMAEAVNYTVIAPLAGTIEQALPLQEDTFVNAGQNLGYISPGGELIVENMILPQDIGLIAIGQKVQFQVDAFDHNQWGLLSGEVIELDKNVTMLNNSTFFKVRCSLKTTELRLKNGYTAKVSKGMTLTSRFFIARRSLYDLLFDKVDDWLNPKLIKT